MIIMCSVLSKNVLIICCVITHLAVVKFGHIAGHDDMMFCGVMLYLWRPLPFEIHGLFCFLSWLLIHFKIWLTTDGYAIYLQNLILKINNTSMDESHWLIAKRGPFLRMTRKLFSLLCMENREKLSFPVYLCIQTYGPFYKHWLTLIPA